MSHHIIDSYIIYAWSVCMHWSQSVSFDMWVKWTMNKTWLTKVKSILYFCIAGLISPTTVIELNNIELNTNVTNSNWPVTWLLDQSGTHVQCLQDGMSPTLKWIIDHLLKWHLFQDLRKVYESSHTAQGTYWRWYSQKGHGIGPGVSTRRNAGREYGESKDMGLIRDGTGCVIAPYPTAPSNAST